MIRQLLKNPRVIFAGYKMPHPLEHEILIKVQTTPDTTPLEVLEQAMKQLLQETDLLKTRFENELTLHAMHDTAANPPSTFQPLHHF